MATLRREVQNQESEKMSIEAKGTIVGAVQEDGAEDRDRATPASRRSGVADPVPESEIVGEARNGMPG